MGLTFLTGLQVPQTLGEEMNVQTTEESYEQTLENSFGSLELFCGIK